MSAAVHLVMPFAHSLRQLEDWGKPEILETNAVMKMAWLLYLEIPLFWCVDGDASTTYASAKIPSYSLEISGVCK